MNRILTIVSLIASIVAISLFAVRCEPITADWMGILVGILSFSVTLLLGWQIYTLIDIQKIQRDAKRSKVEVNISLEKSIAEVHYALWLFYQSKIEGVQQDEKMLLYACLQSGIASTFHFAQCGEYQIAGSCCTSLVRLEEAITRAKLEKKMIQSQIQVLLSMKNPGKIQGYGELLSVLYKCLR